MIEGIKPEWLPDYWGIVEPWIDAACKETGSLWSANQIRDRIAQRQMQLWVVWAYPERPNLCIVTEVYDTAAGLTCSMSIVGGHDLERSWFALDTIEAWAKSQGCVRITCEGRRGWERLMKPRGWTVASVQLELCLGQEQDRHKQHPEQHAAA